MARSTRQEIGHLSEQLMKAAADLENTIAITGLAADGLSDSAEEFNPKHGFEAIAQLLTPIYERVHEIANGLDDLLETVFAQEHPREGK